MSKSKVAEKLPDLREFIKENDQRLYDFCSYMLQGGFSLEELALSIFRDFSESFRQRRGKNPKGWESHEARRVLFEIAWEKIQQMMERIQYTWSVGRDTRPLKALDEDLLATLSSSAAKDKATSPAMQQAMERLTRVEPDFRAAVILRDILKFEDEEVVQILGLRWGVYRHRLHRGRIEFKDALRGRPILAEVKIASAAQT